MAVSDADINSFVQANIGNPQAIADAAQQYGVSAEDLSRATGYDSNTVSGYFGNAGIDMWGQPVAAPVDYAPQQFQQTYTSTNEQGAPVYDYVSPVVNNTQVTSPYYDPYTPTLTTAQPVVTEMPTYDPYYGGYEPDYRSSYAGQPTVQEAATPAATGVGGTPAATGVGGTPGVGNEGSAGTPAGLASLSAGSLGAGLPGTSAKPVDLGDGTFRTPGGNIIDSEGRPVAQATTPAPVRPPPPPEPTYGTVTPYTTGQIKDYVTSVMGDATLAPWQQTNKIMEAAQKAGVSTDDLNKIFG